MTECVAMVTLGLWLVFRAAPLVISGLPLLDGPGFVFVVGVFFILRGVRDAVRWWNAASAAILAVLAVEPGYGLDLMRRVGAHTRGEIMLGPATIYPLLRGLERRGYLRSWEADPLLERGGRPRRYYGLTDLGHAQAAALRAEARSA